MKKNTLVKWFFTLIVFLICAFIAFKNYTPGTHLTGWDNLHPEFNFKLNITRSLNTAWQEYQGVGLLGGMAHAADLPRQIFLWLVSVVVPVSLIRYFWTFLMLFLGPLGLYFLLKNASGEPKPALGVYLGAFVASIFYLLNLATIQYFFVPFESFVSFFGFLPWLLYFVLKYLGSGKTKHLLEYVLVGILASGAFYVQTLFVVYFIFLCSLCLHGIFKFKLEGLKRSFLILFVTFVVNAFWLLPVSWFSLTSSKIPINSQINKIATPETIYMNKARSGFSDIANLRGYWFDYYDFQTKSDSDKMGEFDYLFKDWIDYSQKPLVGWIGVGLFVISVLGLVLSKKFTWVVLLLISYIILLGFEIPIPAFSEAFRNAFTKWSVALSLVLSLGLGFFVSKFKKLSILPALLIIGLAVFSTWPVFEGRLISKSVKTQIPQAYFEIFDWFNQNTQGERVAFFPAFDKWGWNYHDWGHGGSGFVWYGIKNPVLDRAFNVWSPYNEDYFRQINKAILNNDSQAFADTIEKYTVRYILLDESVVFPWGEKNLLKIDNTKSFINSLGYDEVKKNDSLTVYDTKVTGGTFISSPKTYTLINADLTYSEVDPVLKKYGDYIYSESGIGYPFVNLDPRGPVEILFENGQLVFTNKTLSTQAKLEVEAKIEESFAPEHGFENAKNCDLKQKGVVQRIQTKTGRIYTADNGGVSCDYFSFLDLDNSFGYVLHVKGNNTEGRGLKIYLYSTESSRVELEELLPEGEFDKYFVVYPKPKLNQSDKINYTLNVETRSFGRVSSQNEINTIEMLPFDIDLLTNIYIDAGENAQKTNNLEVTGVKKYGTFLYMIDTRGDGLLQLGQGYEPGWIAFKPLEINKAPLVSGFEHVKINSWSNGFLIPPDSGVVYILFWPQILEYVGFLALLLTMGYLIVKLV